MVGKLLWRGMLVGMLAGLLTFGFARWAGEPQVNRAIAFEQAAEKAHGDAPEAELVSRATQASYGLLTGVLVYGAALGGLFSLTFAYAYGRGRLDARALSLILAGAAFIVFVVVPGIKYPPNPPAVGDPETIGTRTGLYFLMLAASLAAALFSLSIRRQFLARLGGWNASLLAVALYIVIVAAVQIGLPAIDEVPGEFPASVLWQFRLASVGMQLIIWAVIGSLFGAWVEHGRRSGNLVYAGRRRPDLA